MTPFLFAVWGGHFKTALMLKEAGADVSHVAHVSSLLHLHTHPT